MRARVMACALLATAVLATSVWGEAPAWWELRYPAGYGHPFEGQSIDLAFAVESEYGTDVPAGGVEVTIEVFDVSGRLVRVLVDGFESEGVRTVPWDGLDEKGREVGSGVHFCRMTVPGLEQTVKMTLLK